MINRVWGVQAMPLIRLDHMLSRLGEGTRSEVKKIIRSGVVFLNGALIKSSDIKIDAEIDKISINGREIIYKEHIYIMLNKPQGVVSASRDPKVQTVIDLLPAELRRSGLFPAGRLDKDTEGLLIITDDGDFAHNILAPKKHVNKIYFAILEEPVNEHDIESFKSGIVLEDGEVCLPASLEIFGNGVRITIREGKYHQIKRMFKVRQNSVKYLKRIAVGGLWLDENLVSGCAREISSKELLNI